MGNDKGTNLRAGKRAGMIDKFIGSKIKIKRIQFGISQLKLGNLLGITFQQLQKCERGLNRTPSGRLYELSKIFNVPATYFFDGAENFLNDTDFVENLNGKENLKERNRELENEVLRLNRFFVTIKDKDRRKFVIDMAKILRSDD